MRRRLKYFIELNKLAFAILHYNEERFNKVWPQSRIDAFAKMRPGAR